MVRRGDEAATRGSERVGADVRDVDVLVVGAGISGICAAYYLQQRQAARPERTFAVLEARETFGGTWDLFKYPGVRSDSDMFTLGFGFHPWREARVLATGPEILAYLKETLEAHDLERHIRYGRRMVSASWSSEAARWTVVVRAAGGEEVWTCRFLWSCTGYYSYEGGHAPTFEGQDDFEGQIIHPQAWPEDLDYSGKRVVVIGSGATAVTIVPAMTDEAAHVTMLQRTPTFIFSLPRRDRVAEVMRAVLPEHRAHAAARWKNALLAMGLYQLSRRFPKQARETFVRLAADAMGDEAAAREHFNPPYAPWDQRLCHVAEDDLFKAIRHGRASVVTDHIERLVPEGVLLRSGDVLEADVIVTATGLRLEIAGGAQLEVDGQPVVMRERMMYKGVMFSGVPNLAMSLGYTNASWTLKCELTSQYFCRVLDHMDAHDLKSCTPRRDPKMPERPLLDLRSGYIQRAAHMLPSQGERLPWRLYQNYILDRYLLRHGAIADEALELR